MFCYFSRGGMAACQSHITHLLCFLLHGQVVDDDEEQEGKKKAKEEGMEKGGKYCIRPPYFVNKNSLFLRLGENELWRKLFHLPSSHTFFPPALYLPRE